jgi:hypothetical protein
MEPTLDGYTPEQIQRLVARYFRDMSDESAQVALQHVADVHTQEHQRTAEAKRNGTYKPNNA